MDYICQHCSKNFSTKGNLKRHINNSSCSRKRGIIVGPKCSCCQKVFRDNTRKTTHEKKCISRKITETIAKESITKVEPSERIDKTKVKLKKKLSHLSFELIPGLTAEYINSKVDEYTPILYFNMYSGLLYYILNVIRLQNGNKVERNLVCINTKPYEYYSIENYNDGMIEFDGTLKIQMILESIRPQIEKYNGVIIDSLWEHEKMQDERGFINDKEARNTYFNLKYLVEGRIFRSFWISIVDDIPMRKLCKKLKRDLAPYCYIDNLSYKQVTIEPDAYKNVTRLFI